MDTKIWDAESDRYTARAIKSSNNKLYKVKNETNLKISRLISTYAKHSRKVLDNGEILTSFKYSGQRVYSGEGNFDATEHHIFDKTDAIQYFSMTNPFYRQKRLGSPNYTWIDQTRLYQYGFPDQSVPLASNPKTSYITQPLNEPYYGIWFQFQLPNGYYFSPSQIIAHLGSTGADMSNFTLQWVDNMPDKDNIQLFGSNNVDVSNNPVGSAAWEIIECSC